MNIPSPPRIPPEKVKPTVSSGSGGGENTAVPIRFQIEGPSCAAAVSTSRGNTSSPKIQPYVPSGSSTRNQWSCEARPMAGSTSFSLAV